jgi:hypothetical protein
MTELPVPEHVLRISLSPEDQIACQELVAEYFARSDRIVDRPAADLYATDGRLRMGPLERDGRDAIAAYFVERRAQEDQSGRRARHLISNFVVEEATDRRTRVRFLALVFGGVGEIPIATATSTTIADCTADCVRSASGIWTLQQMGAAVIFTGLAAAAAAK